MKKFKKISSKIVLTVLTFTMINNVAVYGSIKFKDVSEKYWAYDYISLASEKGLMVGDTSGNFNPEQKIDKFQTSKILARILGFKYTGLTKEEEQYYEKVYNKNKDFLGLYDKNFVKWSKSSDSEISFLLEKEILTREDLDKFVFKDSENKEYVSGLAREEVAKFIVKAIDEEKEAKEFKGDFKFDDDGEMNLEYKQYVYYLKDRGVFTPDENNKFHPKTTVTRAVMATILERTLYNEDLTEIDENDTPLGQVENEKEANGIVSIFSIKGKVDKYYSALNALQVVDSENKKTIYKLSDKNTIYIDGFIKTISDLKEGMELVAVVNSNEIVDIKASSEIISVPDIPEIIIPTPDVEENIEMTKTYKGKIASTTIDKNTITVEIESNGTTEIKKFKLDDDCEIKRDTKNEVLKNIAFEENVTIEATDTTIYSILLDKINRDLKGELIEKRYDSFLSKALIIIKDSSGVTHNLTVETESVITRKGTGRVHWSDIKIGDTIEATVERNKIKEIYAVGNKSSNVGTVENIEINTNINSITIKNSSGVFSTYNLSHSIANVYSIRLGSKVSLKLDSNEIESIEILSQGSASDNLVGVISSVRKNSIMVSNANNANAGLIEVFFDSTTILIDSTTGNYISTAYLKENKAVFIVFSPEDTKNKARTITFIDK